MDSSMVRRDKHDQASHKVIEKRRRDRINNCLTELSQTVPPAFAKQTTGKLEKAEILEMTVEYLRALQATEIGMRFEQGEWYSSDIWTDFSQHYRDGYSECLQEVVRFMRDVEGIDANDARCVRIVSFLQMRFRNDSSVTGSTTTHQDSLHQIMAKSDKRHEGTQSHMPFRYDSSVIGSTINQDTLHRVMGKSDKRYEGAPSRVPSGGFGVQGAMAGLPVSLMTSHVGYLQGAKPPAVSRPSPHDSLMPCLLRHPTGSSLPALSPFLTGLMPSPHFSRRLCSNDSLLPGSPHPSRHRVGTTGS